MHSLAFYPAVQFKGKDDRMRRNMLIGQSGGPTVAINASLSGAVKRAMKHTEIGEIYGAVNGLEGMLQRKIIDLNKCLHSTEDFRRLEITPAMALGSCRYKLPKAPHLVYGQLQALFEKLDIGYFFYIGGNDSMNTILNLSDYFSATGQDIRCVGIPKTIDNDLPCTDHTPGFGSAARYIATAVAEIACDSNVYDIPSVTIVEIMGRDAGWLTASSALARREGCTAPHLIYLPEIPFDVESFITRVRQTGDTVKHIVVAVSEGIKDQNGEYVSAQSGKTDTFGHRALAGVGNLLENLVQERIGCKVRSIQLNVLQRAAAHLYSATDIREACRIGAEAVSFAVKGESGVMAVFHRVSDNPYLVSYESADIRRIANLEKKVPLDWIAENGCNITEKMLRYLRPLIADENGEGIPPFFAFDHSLLAM